MGRVCYWCGKHYDRGGWGGIYCSLKCHDEEIGGYYEKPDPSNDKIDALTALVAKQAEQIEALRRAALTPEERAAEDAQRAREKAAAEKAAAEAKKAAAEAKRREEQERKEAAERAEREEKERRAQKRREEQERIDAVIAEGAPNDFNKGDSGLTVVWGIMGILVAVILVAFADHC